MLMNYFASAFISLFTLIDVILAIKAFHGCDYFQNVEVGKSYYIFTPEYNPNGIHEAEAIECRWAAVAPVGHILFLECDEVYMPLSNNCKEARIEVSASGKSDLSDANYFCGQRSFHTQSVDNEMVVAFRTLNISMGGIFKCRLTALVLRPSQCECGLRNKNRIVNGVETMINEFPMMAGLIAYNKGSVFCGASIISNRFAVSAAHCVMNRNIRELALLVGDHDYSRGDDTKFAALYRLTKKIMHPKYSSITDINDISLLKTSYSITFNEAVGAVCLPFRYVMRSEKFANKVVEATGWGATEFSGPLSTTLQKVKLNVISNKQCNQSYPDGIIPGQLCTYTVDKDTCQSDSGDPLLYTETANNLLYLVGLVSYGRGCATTSPGVNTRITSYLKWIQQNTPNVQYCVK